MYISLLGDLLLWKGSLPVGTSNHSPVPQKTLTLLQLMASRRDAIQGIPLLCSTENGTHSCLVIVLGVSHTDLWQRYHKYLCPIWKVGLRQRLKDLLDNI